MQIGFNNDLEHRGKTFHIQTEDRGLPAAQIETQIFCGGAILDTTIVSYQKIVDSEKDEEARTTKIRTMMQAAHRNLYKKLKSGEYDSMVGLEPLNTGEVVVDEEEFSPGQDRVPSSALEMEQNPEAFDIDPGMGESVDLASLQAALNADAAAAEAAEAAKSSKGTLADDSDADQPTMMITPEELDGPKIAPPKMSPPRMALPTGMLEIPRTGTRAYEGCFAPKEDLSLTAIVEAFLG